MVCKFYVNHKDQKQLYFKINNIINIENSSHEKEISGIYAIYKNNICLYVGQSKNLASRISTHISGKYADADFIYLIDVRNIGFSDFSERTKLSQKAILDNCEKYLIKLLKPIENIIADFSFELDEDNRPDIEDFIPYSFIIDCRFFNDVGELTITNDTSYTVVFIDYFNVFEYYNDIKINEEVKKHFNELFINEVGF